MARFIEDAFERSRTPNGVAGFKLMWEQIRQLAIRLGRTAEDDRFGFHDFAELLPEETRAVLLTRRDRLRQAVSLVKAVQSQCWNSGEQARFTGNYFFDYVGIERAARMLERHEGMWRSFFQRNAITPLEIAYEDVVADRAAVMKNIGAFIGIPDVAGDPGEVAYERQSDDLNDRWVGRVKQIRSCPSAMRAAYFVRFAPRWLALRALSTQRAKRRVRRLPTGERIHP